MTSEHTLGIPASIDEVLITGELAQRPARAPDHAAENRALSALARELAARPRGVLQKLSELALELCNAESAGISILEPGDDGGMFRWHATTGRYTPYLGATIPRDASPCATVIAGTGVQLFREPGRVFPALDELAPAIHEGLLAPWMGDDRAIGTVWAIGHDPERQFDAEDARLLQSLTSFAAAAYRTVTNLGALEEHQRELEERVVERTSLLTQRNQQLRREVEQRREVEAALRDSRAQLQAALSIETVGVLFFELGSAIVDANPAFERMSGYSARALRELDHWKRLTAPEF
jgi:PAS domain-containing protein